ncbi:DUF4129 domain-containing protein [Mycolicibacterium brisbanense]|uniref:Protein-glutamine gamma-glutamyltransferase-like C-terminal domain-containing protein n=1 Tax=Mycolicibacterium brisbanense TaxID=146020 RepID=A0A100W2B1_9MYCO|nr:DUF4129 domain-containing protein [Mycolicibacterium brisbanense]MCV7157658.1 DUF4129 domain-containing protein [Mycolicibacterium brisbanense]GAS90301.1 uncharacterized protein RMCB_4397 [Mycolicibacterium brisbanense]
MPDIDRTTGRTATVLVLLVVAAVAVRGHLPGVTRAQAPPSSDSPASLVALVVLLAVALAGFAFAVFTAPRKPADTGGGDGIGRLELRGLRVRVRWRWVLLAIAVVLAWLLLLVLITRLTATPVLPVPGPATQTPAPPSSVPNRRPDPTGSAPSAFGYLAATTIALLMIVGFGIARAARRAGQPQGLPQDGIRSAPRHMPRGPERLARAAELGLEEIGDLSRDPRAAIIACYVAMERALAHAPGAVPLASDTPSEVLERAVQHHALSADSATELVELFTEARFSPHVMNEAHREAAIQALRRVLAELRSLA